MFYVGQQDYITKLNELSNSIIPHTDTLLNLSGLTSGGGLLCSATDIPAIVQLNGTSPSGTVAYYSPMYPGTYTPGTTTTIFKPNHPEISTATHSFNIRAPDSATTTKAGRVNISGGNNTDTVSGSGGDVNIYGGSNSSGTANANGGLINITAGSGVGTGYGGNITLQVNSTHAVQGYISLRVNSSTVIKCGPTASTLGFFNATPVTKPEVTGSHGSNAALQSLLTALASLGLILNSSTA